MSSNIPHKNKIIMAGDLHGEFAKFAWFLRNISDAYIIQVGDFGAGFHKENYYKTEFGRLNDKLEDTNCHVYAIRGNHDNPAWFKETNNSFDLKNITLLQDYSELNLLGKSILLVGGAISIDRRFRVPDKSYWHDESFVLKLDDEFPYKDRQYDIVVTHTRPGVCGSFKGFSNIKGWLDQDPDLQNDLIEESQALDYLYEHTKPKHWYYGHFHESNLTNHEGTIFRCLDIDELYEHSIYK
jgi:DNA repair exonuclease SbcCD nuclease subunit